MSESTAIGQIVWHDLTVPNASEVKQFYENVVGWKSEDHNMGESNFCVVRDPAGAVLALIEG